MPDFEVDATASAATSDDTNGDDEDGVVIPLLAQSMTVPIQVTVGNATPNTRVQAWIDWNRNGSFAQAGEQILIDVPVVSGVNTFNVPVPATAVFGTTYARFRIADQSGLSFTGLAASGEVEDHQVVVAPPSFPGCTSTPYLAQSPAAGMSSLFQVDTSTNPFTYPPIGPTSSLNYNAIGFNAADKLHLRDRVSYERAGTRRQRRQRAALGRRDEFARSERRRRLHRRRDRHRRLLLRQTEHQQRAALSD